MEDTGVKQSLTDWNERIHHLFYLAWDENSSVDITNYIHRIRHHFKLELIINRLEFYIGLSEDKEREVRYHTNRLKILARAYVVALLELSDDGKMLTSHNIENARYVFSGQNGCDYEQQVV
ncbi:hypothetical protein [Pedobacter miscanthi]|uniref:Uncharacterized protein n=1 Tax=Pedobacter miscanthi TaxID=2259170 RepID=A0A366L1T8_9SPHI|nr:hypothetical protein [Pedobacter miscanthi]RBQ07848.1 hypothetical protein DRW42_09595 [Pedobacter miscanthi]